MTRNKISGAPSGTFRRLLGYVISIHKVTLIFVVIFMVLATLTNIGATYTIQHVIDTAVKMVETGSKDFAPIVGLIALMAGLYIVSIVLTLIYLQMMVKVSQDSLVKLRTELFHKMMGLPLSYFDSHKHGDLMSRFTNDIDATRQMISVSLPNLIVSALTIVGYLSAMIVTSHILAGVTVVVTLILFFIVRNVSRSSKKFFYEQQQSLGQLNGYIEEMIEGQKVVKVFRYEKEAVHHFDILNENLYQNARKATVRTSILIPITVNLSYLAFAIAAALGAYLVSQGDLRTPALVAFLLFTRNFTSPLNQLSQQFNFINVALSGAARVFDVFDQDPEVDNGTVSLVHALYQDDKLCETDDQTTSLWAWKKADGSLVKLSGDVRFKNVVFGYVPNKPILKSITLYAKPGQKIAFVGATGAGKTTITSLINRFYDIQSGVITYDGIDIKDIKKESLRRSLGVVLQDTTLFTGTVLENIRYGNLNVSDESVIQAAKLANAHDFISKLPDGYQTVLTDNGANLSQGQRQLLSIARAAVANPPVLILDEATSSIDTYTERLVQEGMDKLMNDRTVFVIAHRLSTIKNAKAIIVLEQGEIIERGNHQALIDNKGKYYQLYTGAFELE